MAGEYIAVLRRRLAEALRAGRCEDAADLLLRLEEEDPLAVETRGLALERLVRCGAAEDAERLAATLVALFPVSARIFHWAGRAAYKLRRYEAAEARLRESGRLSHHWTTEWWLGKTLTQTGDFDEAEAILTRLALAHAQCRMDLAWLHERRGELGRALSLVEAHLADAPDDVFALGRQTHLRAMAMDADELRDEVETLAELEGDVPELLLPDYVESLLKAGEGERARALVRRRLADLAPRVATRVGWSAYRLGAHDLALEAFLAVLDAHVEDVKLLGALDFAARACDRAGEVADAYELRGERAKKLFGRAKALRAPVRPRRRR